jgi:hypothetical protein
MFPVRALVASLAFASAGAAFAQDAAKPDQPAPAKLAVHVSDGDSWTYDVRDDVTGDPRGTLAFVVTKATSAEIVTSVTFARPAAKGANTEVFDARWRMKDNGKVVFRPYRDDTGVPDDMSLGKSWSFKFQTMRKGAVVGQAFAGVGKVEAWERVKLSNAMSFDCYRIDVRQTTTLAANRHRRETHTVMWFAPAANRLVKRTDETRDNGKLLDASTQTLRAYKPAKTP